jgi:hypothetical protein
VLPLAAFGQPFVGMLLDKYLLRGRQMPSKPFYVSLFFGGAYF